uniref:Cyclin-A N-terminal APC/C binding region domain-containing protein n=1 Tax=Vombatus ursinus TaxID=29139 RepID=A0A4X2L4Y6_VOMUR
MLGHTAAGAAGPQPPRLPRAAGPDENQENIHPDKRGGAEPARPRTVLGVLRVVAPLREVPIHEEQGIVPPWNATSKQPTFTIHVDEPEADPGKKPQAPKKADPEDEALGFHSALSLPEPRKPLVPLDYPMDGSFGEPLDGWKEDGCHL